MRVVGYDPYAADDKFEQLGISRCETLEELLKISDLITLHIPKSPQNMGLIGEKELKMCKKGVRIVNVARGGMIDEKALYDAIVGGHVAAAALDVQVEPNFTRNPKSRITGIHSLIWITLFHTTPWRINQGSKLQKYRCCKAG